MVIGGEHLYGEDVDRIDQPVVPCVSADSSSPRWCQGTHLCEHDLRSPCCLNSKVRTRSKARFGSSIIHSQRIHKQHTIGNLLNWAEWRRSPTTLDSALQLLAGCFRAALLIVRHGTTLTYNHPHVLRGDWSCVWPNIAAVHAVPPSLIAAMDRLACVVRQTLRYGSGWVPRSASSNNSATH